MPSRGHSRRVRGRPGGAAGPCHQSRFPIIARAHSEEEIGHLERHGANIVVMGEHEIAKSMLDKTAATAAPAEQGSKPCRTIPAYLGGKASSNPLGPAAAHAALHAAHHHHRRCPDARLGVRGQSAAKPNAV